MNLSPLFICICSLLLAPGESRAQQDKPTTRKLDDLLSARFPAAAPGCEVLVARKGAIIYDKTFGSANLELDLPLKPGMAFSLASITKQFTAVAILQLVGQGKLSLTDSIRKFVPDFPSKGHTITIENLLTHTSGIGDYMQMSFGGINMERWDFGPGQLIDSFKSRPLEFEPGTRFSYSNSGYYLLGYIIEKISGLRYQRYIEDNLLKPLGMNHTGFDSAGIIIPNRVSGYRRDGDQYRNADYWSPTILYSAGGLISTAPDLFKWHQGLYAGQLLKRETLQKAFAPYVLKDGGSAGYGYGWYIRNQNGVRSIEHQGGLPGFQTWETYYPEQDVFIVILCNSGAAPVDELAVKISGIVLNISLQADIHVDDAILDRYLGTYEMSGAPGRKITILRMAGRVVAKFSEQEYVPLVFQTQTRFQFKNLLNADCEFVLENGKVTRFIVNQNGRYEWLRLD